ncbi:hypothetical protein LXL04_024321 [Taraxacum kok-saghyz]
MLTTPHLNAKAARYGYVTAWKRPRWHAGNAEFGVEHRPWIYLGKKTLGKKTVGEERRRRAVQMRTIIGGGNGGTNLGHLFQFAANQFSDAGALLSAQHMSYNTLDLNSMNKYLRLRSAFSEQEVAKLGFSTHSGYELVGGMMASTPLATIDLQHSPLDVIISDQSSTMEYCLIKNLAKENPVGKNSSEGKKSAVYS